MVKYILLDIDGVLATDNQFMMNSRNFHINNEWARELGVPYPFDKKCVKVFNEILQTTDAEIILSSDWRKFWSLENLDIIFKNNGIIKSPIGTTRITLSYRERSSELKEWVENHPEIENWIILDDINVKPAFPKDMQSKIFITKDLEGIKQTGLKSKIIKQLRYYDNIK